MWVTEWRRVWKRAREVKGELEWPCFESRLDVWHWAMLQGAAVVISDSTSTSDSLSATVWKKAFRSYFMPVRWCFVFFGAVSYDNVQKRCIFFRDRLIFQSKRCAVILASWCRTLTRWFVSLISPVGNLASEITPFLSLRSSSISCPNGGQSHSGVLGGQPWVGGRMRGVMFPPPPSPSYIYCAGDEPSLSLSLSCALALSVVI